MGCNLRLTPVLSVEAEQDKEVFVATVREWPGISSRGESREEVLEGLRRKVMEFKTLPRTLRVSLRPPVRPD